MIALVLFLFLLPFPANQNSVSAFIGTSTSFTVIQGIQSLLGGSSTDPFSTSASFKEFGAGGGTALGIGTSTSFTNHSGIISSIGKTKNAAAAYLTFTVDSNSKSFGFLTPGTVSSQTSSLFITTNNASGFTASASRADADTTLDLDTDALTNISDKTAWNGDGTCAGAGNATASTTEAQTLQFRIMQAGTDPSNYCTNWWGSADTTVSALFAGFPAVAEQIIYRASAAEPETTSVVLYNIDVATTQKTGAYSGSITYTVVANP